MYDVSWEPATKLSDIVHAGFGQFLKVMCFDHCLRKAVKCWESGHLWQSRADWRGHRGYDQRGRSQGDAGPQVLEICGQMHCRWQWVQPLTKCLTKWPSVLEKSTWSTLEDWRVSTLSVTVISGSRHSSTWDRARTPRVTRRCQSKRRWPTDPWSTIDKRRVQPSDQKYMRFILLRSSNRIKRCNSHSLQWGSHMHESMDSSQSVFFFCGFMPATTGFWVKEGHQNGSGGTKQRLGV